MVNCNITIMCNTIRHHASESLNIKCYILECFSGWWNGILSGDAALVTTKEWWWWTHDQHTAWSIVNGGQHALFLVKQDCSKTNMLYSSSMGSIGSKRVWNPKSAIFQCSSHALGMQKSINYFWSKSKNSFGSIFTSKPVFPCLWVEREQHVGIIIAGSRSSAVVGCPVSAETRNMESPHGSDRIHCLGWHHGAPFWLKHGLCSVFPISGEAGESRPLHQGIRSQSPMKLVGFWEYEGSRRFPCCRPSFHPAIVLSRAIDWRCMQLIRFALCYCPFIAWPWLLCAACDSGKEIEER